jgi:hypothetical protein
LNATDGERPAASAADGETAPRVGPADSAEKSTPVTRSDSDDGEPVKKPSAGGEAAAPVNGSPAANASSPAAAPIPDAPAAPIPDAPADPQPQVDQPETGDGDHEDRDPVGDDGNPAGLDAEVHGQPGDDAADQGTGKDEEPQKPAAEEGGDAEKPAVEDAEKPAVADTEKPAVAAVTPAGAASKATPHPPPKQAPSPHSSAKQGLLGKVFRVISHSVRSPGILGLVGVTGVVLCGFLFVRYRRPSTQEMIQEDKPLLDAEEFY